MDKRLGEMAQHLLDNDPASKMLGIQITEMNSESISLAMPVTEQMTNGYQLCHGGFIFTLADTALAFVCASAGEVVVSASSQIEFISPAKKGDELIATAKIAQSNGRQIFAEVTINNQQQQLIALVRGRLVQKR